MQNDSLPPEPPLWVRRADGDVVPFDADKISQALFAATEHLGRPDAFLAHELTDGVLHFLTLEGDGGTLTTQQIADVVVQVVRELGQPLLAETYAEMGRLKASGEESAPVSRNFTEAVGDLVLRLPTDMPVTNFLAVALQKYSLRTVYSRDLSAACEEGFLQLTGLETPGELAGLLLGPNHLGDYERGGIVGALDHLRGFAGEFVALDGTEYLVKQSPMEITNFVRDLWLGLRLTKLRAVVNLNSAAPPTWANELAEGPLFSEQRPVVSSASLRASADRLLEAFAATPSEAERLRVDWHLGAADFLPEHRERLLRVLRFALDGGRVGFVFDRPRCPVSLAEGLDRQHSAVLSVVGLHLPRLLEQPRVQNDRALFLEKLGSLARLALSAGVQKREYLRRQQRTQIGKATTAPPLTSGFLLDRARLVVVPVGLDSVVRSLTGSSLVSGGPALELARQILLRLSEVLRQGIRASHLEACLDGPFDFHLGDGNSTRESAASVERVAGLTAWEPSATVPQQLRAVGILHHAAERGTLALFLPNEPTPRVEQVADWLLSALESSEVRRVHLLRASAPGRQLSFGGLS